MEPVKRRNIEISRDLPFNLKYQNENTNKNEFERTQQIKMDNNGDLVVNNNGARKMSSINIGGREV